jgi:hypothetical protein
VRTASLAPQNTTVYGGKSPPTANAITSTSATI